MMMMMMMVKKKNVDANQKKKIALKLNLVQIYAPHTAF